MVGPHNTHAQGSKHTEGDSPHITFWLSQKENRALGDFPSPLSNRSLLDKRQQNRILPVPGHIISCLQMDMQGFRVISGQPYILWEHATEGKFQGAFHLQNVSGKMIQWFSPSVCGGCLPSISLPSFSTGQPSTIHQRDRMWLWARAKCES